MIDTILVGGGLFVLGAIVGSFLNVCIYRLPKRASIVLPQSHCPRCKVPLPWHDNIPILSYLILEGRCRFCHKAIHPRYLIVETLTGVLAVLIGWVFPTLPQVAVFFILTCLLIVATFVDFEFQMIPDEVSYLGLGVGLVASVLVPAIHGTDHRLWSVADALLGAAAGGGLIYLIGVVGKWIFKREAMGGGDVKLLAMIGTFLGWKLTLLVFFVAPIFGSIVGIIMRIRYRAEIIPYGPYLSLASLVALFFGQRILQLLFLV